MVLVCLRVPDRDAFREMSTILLRREDRGRRGLGDRTAPSSESSSSSSSSSKSDARNGDTDRGSEGGARVDRKSSLSEVNFAITCSNACDSVSVSKVTVKRELEGSTLFQIDEDIVGRLSGMMLVVIRRTVVGNRCRRYLLDLVVCTRVSHARQRRVCAMMRTIDLVFRRGGRQFNSLSVLSDSGEA